MNQTPKAIIGLEIIEVFESYTLYYDREYAKICVWNGEELFNISSDELAEELMS